MTPLEYLRARWADLASTVAILLYHALAVLALGAFVVVALPTVLGDSPAGAGFPWWRGGAYAPYALGAEGTLVLVAASAGALGAILHAMHFTVHVARDTHDWRWAPWHFLQPFRGALLGLVTYLGSRAGIAVLSGGAETNASPYAVVFASLVAGLFAKRTLDALGKRLGTPDGREGAAKEKGKDDASA